MAGYVQRAIAELILRDAGVPVLVLEGARAVGKTTMMRRQVEVEGYSYASFADRATLEFAAQDTAGWLRRLSLPAIIDEAQLLPGFPLELKEFVDGLGPGNHVIVTGSASIGRDDLGSADPLTRRALRLLMSPITQWEAAGHPGSVVDLLFSGMPRPRRMSSPSDDEILRDLTVGGFPSYLFPDVVQTRRQIMERVRSDVTSVLGDVSLSGSGYDTTISRAVLDLILREPGGIFNASRMAQALDLDRRTVDRYLSHFTRLFLVHSLPNLATAPSRQTHTRSKIHPIDTSFAVESLARAGVDLSGDREKFGSVVESHVVNQIVAGSQWATVKTDAFFWRQASATNPEVDLVLKDDQGRYVAIEVKTSSTIRTRDLRGIQAFRTSRGLHRGFIFYRGSDVVQLEADIWALPISALGDTSAFTDSVSSEAVDRKEVTVSAASRHNIAASFDASLFVSYVHADNVRSGDRIVRFAKDLAETYSYLYGREIELFIDRDDIAWGENWRNRLEAEAQRTSFLLSVVTPRYLMSEACRSEVLTFAAAAKNANDQRLLLPLQWIDVTNSDVVAADDPVRVQLLESQYVDVSELRTMEVGSSRYEQVLGDVAARLKQTIDLRRERGSHDVAAGADSSTVDEPDLITVMEDLEGHKDEFEAASATFKAALEGVTGAMSHQPQIRLSGTYGASAALARMGEQLKTPVAELEEATARIGQVWQEYDSGISRLVRDIGHADEPTIKRNLWESLDGLVRVLDVPGIDDMARQLTLMGNMSRHLQPMSYAVSAALQLLRGIQVSARAWRDRLV